MSDAPKEDKNEKPNVIPSVTKPGDLNKPEKNVEKVVTGKVVQKKPSFVVRVKESFFGGDAHSVARYVGMEVLLPALRNLVVDTVTKGVERAMFGDTVSRRRGPVAGQQRFQYDNPLLRERGQAYLPHQPPQIGMTRRHAVGDILVASRDDAERVVERLTDIIDTYNMASVADLYELLGMPTTYVDNNWGWTSLAYADIRQTRDGYLIDIPPAVAL